MSLPTPLCIILASIAGVFIHYFILYRILFKNLFGAAFGRLWLLREIGYIGQCVIFVLVVGPTMQSYKNLEDAPFWIKCVFQVAIMFSYVCVISNLLIAINRYCIVSFPLEYKLIFSMRRTAVVVVLIWIVCAVATLPSLIPDCLELAALPFEPIDGVLTDEEHLWCVDVRQTLNWSIIQAAVCFTLIIDAYTFKAVRTIFKNRSKMHVAGPMQKELKLCNMIVAQQVVSILGSACFNSSYFFANRLPKEAHLDILSWAASTMLDGLVVVIFTPDFFKFSLQSEQYSTTEQRTSITHVSYTRHSLPDVLLRSCV
ncbi:hypothetical protein L596_012568 [Steinernema carpocapsae]|uniref:G-protein coupled receptors family 1 profile domain-containing protein n=1 Tax=Steinernema carpocapsae TaxID=34508 RepID=A0A4U5NXL3_STECR|nr:hypothetical protein L596_012568 [Steinernema carpocapsae]